MEEYFALLAREADTAYQVAQRARAVGIDPEPTVEIPRAEDMASRVEKLLRRWNVEGIAPRIRELARTLPREEVALRLAEEIASETSRGNLETRLDTALRVGLAILTEGILVAPLEGLAEIHVRDDPQGPYVDLFYAGPIRAAGGTAQALSVLLADRVRRSLGLAAFRATPEEIGRYKEEIPLYKHLQHLQYTPSPEEIETVVANLPVCVNGEATERKEEVSAFRDLPRVGTNGIRGGACLVLAEGICLKAPKLRKIVERLGIPGWEFLAHVGQKGTPEKEVEGNLPKYLAETLGGRPILSYPRRPGGFRLVYGRSRTTGLAAAGVNPATMVVLRHFVAVGTQVKTEFPGKAAAMSLCDTVEGPLVLLEDGSLVEVNDVAEAERLLPRIRQIVDLGEILFSYGEFLENNRPLMPGGYSLAWHLETLRARGLPIDRRALAPTFDEAVSDARDHGVPLHPRYNLFWHDLALEGLVPLSRTVERTGRWENSTLLLPASPELKADLITLGVPHQEEGGTFRLSPRLAPSFLRGLGLEVSEGAVRRRTELPEILPGAFSSTLEVVEHLAGIRIRPRGPTRVGLRVGRPEKARQRTMDPNVHALFPVGEAGGPQRSLVKLLGSRGRSGVPLTLGIRKCPSCGTHTPWGRCPCGAHTAPTGKTVTQEVQVGSLFEASVKRLGLPHVPGVKGVKSLMSESRTPEPLEKGILRAFHGVSVYQDGTARFDLSDLPLTHVRPREIGLSVATARSLGYQLDWMGDPLESPDQLVELRPHDIVVSQSCGEYLVRIARFVDDELRLLYDLPPFYRARTPQELVGQLVIALAPHTSGGVLGRILGYTSVEGCFAHPVFHAAKRRNCDGDEDSVTLLLDGLLNFSFAYLPTTRGALMDKPLVLTTRLDAREVDKEAHNVDLSLRYPLALYEAAERGASPKEVEGIMDLLGKRLGTPGHEWTGYGFTHDTTDIAGGPVRSAYREARGMEATVGDSLALESQIRAVDLPHAVALVLNHHFLPDLMGNLKSYATQRFRCKACNASYRRPPLDPHCTAEVRGQRCGGDLLPTVYPGAVTKYLGLSQRLAKTHDVSHYLRQRLDLLEGSLATLFPVEKASTASLERYADPGSPTPGEEEPPPEAPEDQ